MCSNESNEPVLKMYDIESTDICVKMYWGKVRNTNTQVKYRYLQNQSKVTNYNTFLLCHIVNHIFSPHRISDILWETFTFDITFFVCLLFEKLKPKRFNKIKLTKMCKIQTSKTKHPTCIVGPFLHRINRPDFRELPCKLFVFVKASAWWTDKAGMTDAGW